MYNKGLKKYNWEFNNNKGRFPANVLCENNVLNDGNTRKSGGREGERNITWGDSFINTKKPPSIVTPCTKDEGSFSHYFSLDAWFAERIKHLPKEAQKTFPWLIVPKASKSEKERKLEKEEKKTKHYGGKEHGFNANDFRPDGSRRTPVETRNVHPTIKPLKLMSWLITLGSREGDIILDPFMGSGTTPLAAKMTHRYYIGIEREKEFFNISVKRIDEAQRNMDSFL